MGLEGVDLYYMITLAVLLFAAIIIFFTTDDKPLPDKVQEEMNDYYRVKRIATIVGLMVGGLIWLVYLCIN